MPARNKSALDMLKERGAAQRNGKGTPPNPPARQSPSAPAPSAPAPKKKVRQLEQYKPFPTEAMPSPLREYVTQSAVAMGCDPAFVALPVLAVVASMVGNTRVIKLKGGWTEPCVVWAAIVGDSGSLKTPAYLKAVAPVLAQQKRLREEYKQELANYADEVEKYKAAKAEAKENGTEPPEEPEQPVLKRVVVSDSTIEKLAELLEDNPRGLLLARDELAAWLGSFGRYKGRAGGSDLPHWLEMFRAG